MEQQEQQELLSPRTENSTEGGGSPTGKKKKRSFSPVQLASSLLGHSQRIAAVVGNGVVSGVAASVRKLSRDSSPSRRSSVVSPSPQSPTSEPPQIEQAPLQLPQRAAPAVPASAPVGAPLGTPVSATPASVPTRVHGAPVGGSNSSIVPTTGASRRFTPVAQTGSGTRQFPPVGQKVPARQPVRGRGPPLFANPIPVSAREVQRVPSVGRGTSKGSGSSTGKGKGGKGVGKPVSSFGKRSVSAGNSQPPSRTSSPSSVGRKGYAQRQPRVAARQPPLTIGVPLPSPRQSHAELPSPRPSHAQLLPRQAPSRNHSGTTIASDAALAAARNLQQPNQFPAQRPPVKFPPDSPHLFQPYSVSSNEDTEQYYEPFHTHYDQPHNNVPTNIGEVHERGSHPSSRRISLASLSAHQTDQMPQQVTPGVGQVVTPESSKESLGGRMQSVANSDHTHAPSQQMAETTQVETGSNVETDGPKLSNTGNIPKVVTVSINDQLIKLVVLKRENSEFEALASVYKKAGLTADVALRVYSSSREAILKWEELINRETLLGVTEPLELPTLVEALIQKFGSLGEAVASATRADGNISLALLHDIFESVSLRHFVYPLWSVLSSGDIINANDMIDYLSALDTASSDMPTALRSPRSHAHSTAAASLETASVRSNKLDRILEEGVAISSAKVSEKSEYGSETTNERRLKSLPRENDSHTEACIDSESKKRESATVDEHNERAKIELLGNYLKNFVETDPEAELIRLEESERDQIRQQESIGNSDIQGKLIFLSIETSRLTSRQALMMLEMQSWAAIKDESIEQQKTLLKKTGNQTSLQLQPPTVGNGSVWDQFENRLQQRGSGMSDLTEVTSEQIMELAKQFGFDLVDSIKIKSAWRSRLPHPSEHSTQLATPVKSHDRTPSFRTPERTPARTPKTNNSSPGSRGIGKGGGKTEIVAPDSELFKTVSQVTNNTATCQNGSFSISKILEIFPPQSLIAEYNVIRKSGVHQKPQMVYYQSNDKPDISELVNYGFSRELSRVGKLTFSTTGEINGDDSSSWLLLCEILPGYSVRGDVDDVVDADSSFSERVFVTEGDVKTEKRFHISAPSRVKPRYAVFPSVVMDPKLQPRSLTSGVIAYCPIHPKEELRLYCDSEKELTCSLCASVGRHSEKYCKSLAEVIKEMRSDFVQNEKLVGTKIGKLESERIRLQSQQAALSDAYSQAMASLEARAACVHAEVDAYQRLLSDSFKRKQIEITTAISDSSTETGQKLDSLREAQQFLRSLLEPNNSNSDHGISQKASEIIALNKILQNDKLRTDASTTLNTSLVSTDFVSFYQSEIEGFRLSSPT